MIISKALPDSTKSFCDKFPQLNRSILGKSGLTVSSCGFGSYRVDYRVKEHSEALEYAILNGINLIDTSSNYSDGGSEVLIGKVLNELIDENKIKREEIVIVSKGGYIQGKNFDIASKRIEEDNPYAEIVEYTDKLWHCIHPDFLKDQITASLERLDMETIDVYLLHNPEYFLDSPYAGTLTLDELRHEYYSRIKKAFEYLERETADGRIGCYGISSNSFVVNSNEQTFTSLSMCYKIAERINPNYNFKVVQFPFNLFERGAIANKNQEDDTKTLMEYAREKDFGVLVNRPLNAILGKSLRRLADFETEEKYINLDEAQIIAEINLLDSMEEDFLNEHLKTLELEQKISDAVGAFLKAGQLLKENWKGFNTIENFNDLKKQFLIPRVNYAFGMMLSSPNITEEMKDKLDKIARQVNKLVGIIETLYGVKANERSKDLHLNLNQSVSQTEADKFKDLSLSQKTIALINSVAGVDCVLVGMRQNKYADDVNGAMKFGKIENAEDILMKLEV